MKSLDILICYTIFARYLNIRIIEINWYFFSCKIIYIVQNVFDKINFGFYSDKNTYI